MITPAVLRSDTQLRRNSNSAHDAAWPRQQCAVEDAGLAVAADGGENPAALFPVRLDRGLLNVAARGVN
ncbi:MAG: hypothetical protein ACP5QB_06705 [Thiomonas sp.]